MRLEPAAPRPTLAEAQAWFHRSVTGASVDGDEALPFVVSDDRFPRRERLGLYAGMYRHRLLEALAIDAPRTAEHLAGDYEDVALAYLSACPPRGFSLREVSDRWAPFLAGHPVGGERPWLADLAALERTRLEVFDARDDELLAPSAFHGNAERVMLRLVRAHARLVIDRRALDGWIGAVPPTPPRCGASTVATLAVWRGRDPMIVHHRPLDGDEAVLWPTLERGIAFGELCEVLARDRPDEVAIALAARLVRRWLDQALLAT